METQNTEVTTEQLLEKFYADDERRWHEFFSRFLPDPTPDQAA